MRVSEWQPLTETQQKWQVHVIIALNYYKLKPKLNSSKIAQLDDGLDAHLSISSWFLCHCHCRSPPYMYLFHLINILSSFICLFFVASPNFILNIASTIELRLTEYLLYHTWFIYFTLVGFFCAKMLLFYFFSIDFYKCRINFNSLCMCVFLPWVSCSHFI